MRGIRGAITVAANEEEEILAATELLLKKIIAANKIQKNEMVSMIFTATEDLDRIYPAVAARQIGYTDIPLMCYQEMYVRGALDKCLRVMLYIDRDCDHREIEHVYLRRAKSLRPDLS